MIAAYFDSDGTYLSATNLVSWTLPDLQPGDSTQAMFVVQVGDVPSGTFHLQPRPPYPGQTPAFPGRNMAIQYIGHAHDRESLLQEGRRIGEFFGQQCAQHRISLVDTVRARFFFYERLLQAAWHSQAGAGQPAAENL